MRNSSLIEWPVFLFAKSVQFRWRRAGHCLHQPPVPVHQGESHQGRRALTSGLGGESHRGAVASAVWEPVELPVLAATPAFSVSRKVLRVSRKKRRCGREQGQTGNCIYLSPASMQKRPVGNGCSWPQTQRSSGRSAWWELRT